MSEFVLIAPVFEDVPVFRNWGDIEPFLNIFPIDGFDSLPSDNDHSFRFSVANNRCNVGLDRISPKCCELLVVAVTQFVFDNVSDLIDGCRLPAHT